MAEGVDRALTGRAALLVRVTGQPGRLDSTALDTFRLMMTDTPTREGFTGMQCMLVDVASSTLVILAMFESRAAIAKLSERTRAAIEVAAAIIGADPKAAIVDVLDVVDVPGTPADIRIT